MRLMIDGAVQGGQWKKRALQILIVKKSLSQGPITYIQSEWKIQSSNRHHWFLMKTNYKAKLVPQIEENIQKAEWKSKDEI